MLSNSMGLIRRNNPPNLPSDFNRKPWKFKILTRGVTIKFQVFGAPKRYMLQLQEKAQKG